MRLNVTVLTPYISAKYMAFRANFLRTQDRYTARLVFNKQPYQNLFVHLIGTTAGIHLYYRHIHISKCLNIECYNNVIIFLN